MNEQYMYPNTSAKWKKERKEMDRRTKNYWEIYEIASITVMPISFTIFFLLCEDLIMHRPSFRFFFLFA